MKKILTFFSLALVVGARAEMGAGMIDKNTTTLYGGMVYTVSGNVSISGGAGKSAITVEPGGGDNGKRVVIDIPAGSSLTVTGGAGSNRTGGGAGILLPGDMTLYVTGKGTLTATGGNAGVGGVGNGGGNAEYSNEGDNHHKNGAGGSGGSGGGGAGAGNGGNGGAGGAGGAQGGAGHLYALPSVGLSVSPFRASDAVEASAFANFLEVDVTLDLGLKDASGKAVTTSFKQPFAYALKPIDDIEVNGVNPRVKRAGYRFAGFWTDDGTCLYGPDYKPTMVLSPYAKAFTLHARWEVAPEMLSVTSSGDGASALDVYGNAAITLRDAVNALVADPLLVGTDGRRRVTFEKLEEGDTTIRLAGALEIPAGVRSFEINGLYGLEKGVTLVAAPGAWHFGFKGKPSDAGSAFSLASLTIQGGDVAASGGAVLMENDAALAIDACAFVGNRAAADGGAIALAAPGSELLVSATTFSRNSATGGGAAHVAGAQALFVNTTFGGNAADDLGGALVVSGGGVDLLSCTFAHNSAKAGRSIRSAGADARIRAVNCIFAEAQAIFKGGGKVTEYWCSTDAAPAKVFAEGGAAVTQTVAGVAHSVFFPLGGALAGNEDAAEIYHDPSYENILAVGPDGTEVVLAGSRDLAKIPFVLDQLQAVRTAPTRGAIRLAVGTAPVTVELDGVLLDSSGAPRANETVPTDVTVSYSDGSSATTNLAIKTAACGVFGLSVPVDGSDGMSHNVTGVEVAVLGANPIDVTMAPYALVASSVELLGASDYLPLYGDSIAIGNVAAGSISVTNSFDARAAGSFTAGSLKGFKEIDMEHVSVAGGSLEWLGGQYPAARSDAFANLSEMTVGGGVPAAVESTLTVGKGKTLWRTWQAESDGFFQLQARTQKPKEGEIQLRLLDKDDNVLVNVTELGRAGDSDGLRRLLWTVPVRAGDKVDLAIRPADDFASFELTSVKAQFICFGVAE